MNRNSTSLVLASAPCCLVSDILWPQLCEAWCLKEAWAGCKELDSDGQGKWAQAKQCQNPTQLDQPVICYLAYMLAPMMAPRVLPSDIPRVPGGNDETCIRWVDLPNCNMGKASLLESHELVELISLELSKDYDTPLQRWSNTVLLVFLG